MKLNRISFNLAISVAFLGLSISAIAQDSPYDFSYKSHKTSLISTFAFYTGVQIHNLSIGRGVIADVERVNPDNLWKIDQGSINLFSKSSDSWSDITMYGSIALPIVLNLSPSLSKSSKWNIALMGMQGYMIENGINVLTKNIAQRPRPFLYNNEWIINNRSINKNSSRSFYSGHTSSSAYFCFFGAKVFSDLNPDSRWKPYVWGLAIALPAITGYLRYDAGQHFPTDIIVGYIAGAGIGYLIPSIYKNKGANLSLGLSDLHFSLKF